MFEFAPWWRLPGRSARWLLPLVLALRVGAETVATADDPYRWLEDVDDARALAWVEEHNVVTARRLTTRPEYESLRQDALKVLNSASRIPMVAAHGGYLYNLWQDEAHPRGLFRRTTPAGFREENPPWETVLNVDALARAVPIHPTVSELLPTIAQALKPLA